MAFRWLYGDLVHANDLRGKDHDLSARYEAGVFLTANIAVRVITLLIILRSACERGLVTLDDVVFTEEVRATTSHRLEARAAWAPVGTPASALEAVLDATSDDDA